MTNKPIEVVTTYEEQLRRWCDGDSVHVNFRGGGVECCPDFSCCKPHLLQPVEVRRAFTAADQKGRNKFLMAFLGGAISDARPELRVHIIGGEPELES